MSAADGSSVLKHSAPGSTHASRPLDHIPLFSSLDDAEQQALFTVMKVESFPANQTVFWMGDQGGTFYVISQGEVAVSVPSEDGDHITLSVLGPGGFFGEISLLDGGNRTATVRTTLPTELYALSREDFHAFLKRRPDCAIDILTIMGRRQRASTEALRGLQNPNTAFAETRVGIWERFCDGIVGVAASQPFFAFHAAWFGGWILFNMAAKIGLIPEHWSYDPFPFGLLTLIVSLEAIFLSMFVLISQNRSAEKDRLCNDLDYHVNLKAQTEIMRLHEKIDRLTAKLGHGDSDVERLAQEELSAISGYRPTILPSQVEATSDGMK